LLGGTLARHHADRMHQASDNKGHQQDADGHGTGAACLQKRCQDQDEWHILGKIRVRADASGKRVAAAVAMKDVLLETRR
jgi:hypothetical protein